MPKQEQTQGGEKLSPGEGRILKRLQEIEAEIEDLSERIDELKEEIKEEK